MIETLDTPSGPAPGKLPPALVLNADFRPLSYYPLSLWSWQDVMKAVYEERVDIITTYDRTVHSPSREWQLPSVIALKQYSHKQAAPAFTKFNVFLRDNFCCQYCGEAAKELTFEHVIPRSKGGKTNWENIATACVPCNTKKADKDLDTIRKTLGMDLRRKPHRPDAQELKNNGRKFPPGHLHRTWIDYLYWDVELEIDRSDPKVELALQANPIEVPSSVTDMWLEIAKPVRSQRSPLLKPRELVA